MKYNTQNATIKSITEKPLEFSNNGAGFVTFKAMKEDFHIHIYQLVFMLRFGVF